MKEENELYGLAYNCPTLQRKDNCPFMQVEHLAFIEKVNWNDGLIRISNKKLWKNIRTAQRTEFDRSG